MKIGSGGGEFSKTLSIVGDLLYYFVIAATDYIVTACDYIIAACDFIISGSDYRIIACPVRFLCLNTVLFSGVILSNGIDPFFYVG